MQSSNSTPCTTCAGIRRPYRVATAARSIERARTARPAKTAAWTWTLDQFCAALDWEVDDYSRQKFKEFQVAGRALGLFAGDTLRRIIDTVTAEEEAKRRHVEEANVAASLRLSPEAHP